MSKMARSAIRSVPRGELRLLPPFSSGWPHLPREDAGTSQLPVHVCILDSSFNPPTLAHLTLASSAFPKVPSIPPGPVFTNQSGNEQYTARLLLFSTSNADKTPSPGDPTLDQRLELISLLAAHISSSAERVAVGLINEPTFVGKSKIIHSFLSSHGPIGPPKLSFIVGTDTLTRCFDPRYYGAVPGGMAQSLAEFFEHDGSTLVCGRRKGESGVEAALLKRDEVRHRVEKRHVRFFGTGEEEWAAISSTQVREAVRADEWERVKEMVIPEVADYIQKEGLYSS